MKPFADQTRLITRGNPKLLWILISYTKGIQSVDTDATDCQPSLAEGGRLLSW